MKSVLMHTDSNLKKIKTRFFFFFSAFQLFLRAEYCHPDEVSLLSAPVIL